MNYERFLIDKLIKKQIPDFKQIECQLKRARKDLKTAELNLSIDLTWAFAIAYHAMMRASKALMYSNNPKGRVPRACPWASTGYLPIALRSHKTIIEFAKLSLGSEYENLIVRFNRMRRQRHDFIRSRPENRAIHGADEQWPLSINHNRLRPLDRSSRRLIL